MSWLDPDNETPQQHLDRHVEQACNALRRRDPVLRALIRQHGVHRMNAERDYFQLMVATIISILALIALPTFLGRLKIARITATQDEMSQIAKGLQVSFADTGHHFRLQDLDNVNRYLTPLTNIEQFAEVDRFVPSA